MKGTAEDRKDVKGDVLFANEIYIYKTVVPTLIKRFKSKFKTIEDKLWCPRIYYADLRVFPELSEEKEAILALEDLTPLKYRLGDRSSLTEPELRLMVKAIAEYHACSYALKIQKDPLLEELKAGIIPLPFEYEDTESAYDVIYQIAVERIVNYFETDFNYDSVGSSVKKLKADVAQLKDRYQKCPLKLMDRFRRDDEIYSVILHGDFNRNNVLFQYDDCGNPINIRMFDFQELRYGTPAIDLTFTWYANMPSELLKAGLFEKLLLAYHEHLIGSICELVECSKNDSRLKPYSYDNLYNHFRQFAFYGGMVAIHFIPWMGGSEAECAEMARTSSEDVKGEAFRKIATTSGGNVVNQRMAEVVVHASKNGYMDLLYE